MSICLGVDSAPSVLVFPLLCPSDGHAFWTIFHFEAGAVSGTSIFKFGGPKFVPRIWARSLNQRQAPKGFLKMGPKCDRFLGTKLGPPNLKLHCRPSHVHTHFFDQNLGAFLGPPPWTCDRKIGCSDYDTLSPMATPGGLPTTIIIAATATASAAATFVLATINTNDNC